MGSRPIQSRIAPFCEYLLHLSTIGQLPNAEHLADAVPDDHLRLGAPRGHGFV
jgi:hypothetical protein